MQKIIIDEKDINFLPLTKDDIPALLKIQEEAFAVMTNSDTLRRNTYETLEVCFAPPSLALGAYYNGELIAFGILYAAGTDGENLAYSLDEHGDLTNYANVKLTIVRPAYRGNGLQRQLITRLERHAKACGFKILLSTVSPENSYSCNNLSACGYTHIKTLKKYGGLQRYLFYKEI